MNLPKNRRPTCPGEILRHEFLLPLGITQLQLAKAIGVTRVRINEIILDKRSLTPDTAFRLAKYFNTSPDFWINLQKNVDMWDTFQNHRNEYNPIQPFHKMVASIHKSSISLKPAGG
jgi:antitoxin HigA-1